jgi:hypothetical protein
MKAGNQMNAKTYLILLAIFFITACSNGPGSDSSESAIREIQTGVTESAFIELEGDVDTYRIRAAEANRFMNINCKEKSSGSGVDLLVTVYEENAGGQRVRLFGKHKPQNSTPPANLDVIVYIDRPKDLFITVRDLLDNDASEDIAYHLTCDFLASEVDNHDFENARPLIIGAANASSDAIEAVGEMDCFTFSVDTSGVYTVNVDHTTPHNATTNVQLTMTLYDHIGNKIQSVTAPDHTLLSCLEPNDNPFFITIQDSDGMHMDAAAIYDISIAQAPADEFLSNDILENASEINADAAGIFAAGGAVEYASSSASGDNAGDMDWYQFTVPENSAAAYQTVQLTIDNGQVVNSAAILRVVVYDALQNKITSHDFYCNKEAYRNQFRAESGVHYVSVAPLNANKIASRASYLLQLQPTDLIDDYNNTENEATVLQNDVPVEGTVSYHSDVDWYGLTVNTTTPKIVEVELTSDTSIVDYQLTIWRGVQLIKKVSDLNGSDGRTHLKIAIFVPQDSQGTALYHFKVCDAQNDEGSSILYELTTTTNSVPTDIPGIGEIDALESLRYYSEIDEQAQVNGTYEALELEIFSGYQPIYLANTGWLDFRADFLPVGIAAVNHLDGTTTITFPWIAGYIDYQGDHDFFEIDFGKRAFDGIETDWYYDVAIRLVVPQPGSEVEYIWKLYRDRNQNHIIMDDPTSPDGYKACAGDETPLEQQGLDIMVPSGDQVFWIGSEWGDNSKFYIGISDFNFEKLPGPESREFLEDNPVPDDDWGYDAPYYFQVQLTYHPGDAWPD